MSNKQKIFRHLNQVWDIKLPLNPKLVIARSILQSELGLFRWWVRDPENHILGNLGSQYQLKELVEIMEYSPLCIYKNTFPDVGVYEIIDFNENFNFIKKIKIVYTIQKINP